MPKVQAQAPELPSCAPPLVIPGCNKYGGELEGGWGPCAYLPHPLEESGEATVEPGVVAAACRSPCGHRTCSHAND